jgi:hypothetical protein
LLARPRSGGLPEQQPPLHTINPGRAESAKTNTPRPLAKGSSSMPQRKASVVGAAASTAVKCAALALILASAPADAQDHKKDCAECSSLTITR